MQGDGTEVEVGAAQARGLIVPAHVERRLRFVEVLAEQRQIAPGDLAADLDEAAAAFVLGPAQRDSHVGLGAERTGQTLEARIATQLEHVEKIGELEMRGFYIGLDVDVGLPSEVEPRVRHAVHAVSFLRLRVADRQHQAVEFGVHRIDGAERKAAEHEILDLALAGEMRIAERTIDDDAHLGDALDRQRSQRPDVRQVDARARYVDADVVGKADRDEAALDHAGAVGSGHLADDVEELQRLRLHVHVGVELGGLEADDASFHLRLERLVVDAERPGLDVQRAPQVERDQRAFETSDVDFLQIPPDVRVRVHAEIGQQLREACILHQCLGRQRKPRLQRLELDIDDLGDSTGHVHGQLRELDGVVLDGEVAGGVFDDHPLAYLDALDLEATGYVRQGAPWVVVDLGLDGKPAVERGRAGHAVQHRERHAHGDAAATAG